jgi:RNA recognition motif-containing protein
LTIFRTVQREKQLCTPHHVQTYADEILLIIIYFIRNESIKDKFSPYGEIGDVYIPRSFGSSEPRGFAFVRFIDKKDAEDAQRALDGTELDGREIKIQEARERRAENPREAMNARRG